MIVARRAPGHLFLIGFRAAGKSSVGRILAQALGAPFVDLDQQIAESAGRPVGEVLREEGERAFRIREERALRGLWTAPRSVVATGGGVVERAASRRLLTLSGSCVWLDPPVDVIRRRMEADPHRPAVGGGCALAEIDALLGRRRPWYQRLAAVRIRPSEGEAECGSGLARRILRAARLDRTPGLPTLDRIPASGGGW